MTTFIRITITMVLILILQQVSWARYYDSRLARWIIPDPALQDGMYLPSGNPEKDKNLAGIGGVYNTINLDLYQYAGMNPVKYIDPDGKEISLKYFPKHMHKLYWEARAYMAQTDRGKELLGNLDKKVSEGGVFVVLMFEPYSTRYGNQYLEDKSGTVKGKVGVIDWDPFTVFIYDDKHKQSPAMVLAHELGHAEQHMMGEKVSRLNFFELSSLESKNLKKTEHPIANQLRKLGHNEGIRPSWEPDTMKTFTPKSVHSTEEK